MESDWNCYRGCPWSIASRNLLGCNKRGIENDFQRVSSGRPGSENPIAIFGSARVGVRSGGRICVCQERTRRRGHCNRRCLAKSLAEANWRLCHSAPTAVDVRFESVDRGRRPNLLFFQSCGELSARRMDGRQDSQRNKARRHSGRTANQI